MGDRADAAKPGMAQRGSHVQRGRWLLLTAEGRRVLLVVYLAAALVSVVTYGILHSLGYAVGQVIVLGFAPLWARWCLRRA